MAGDKHYITSAEEYQRYLEGNMPPKERHAFEKRMLDDEFEQDAMDGLSMLQSAELNEDLDALKAKISARYPHKRAPLIWRVAAVITLFAVFSFATYFVLNIDSDREVTQSKKTIPDMEEDQVPQALLRDSLIEMAPEEDSSSLLTFGEPLGDAEAQKPLNMAEEEISLPVTGQVELMEAADDEEFIDEIEIADEEPAASAAVADQFEAEDIRPAQLPAIERDEILEAPLEITPAGEATERIASERVAPTQMDQSNFVARIKDVRTVTGKITSEEDATAIPGVNVLVKGSAIGTVTDIDGNYSIEVAPGQYNLFSL